MSFIIRFFSGTISKKALVSMVIPLILAVLIGTLLYANLVYPTAFDWRYLVISKLIDEGSNPGGYLVASIGITVSGALMIPLAGYHYRRYSKICRGTSIVATIFLLLGIVGLISVGTIGQVIHTIDKFHEILAGVGFLGLVLAGIIFYCPVIKDWRKGSKQFNMKLATGAFIVLLFPVVGMAASQIVLAINNPWGWVSIDWIDKGAPVLLSFALWEWALMGCIVVHILLMAVFTPDEVTPFVKKERAEN